MQLQYLGHTLYYQPSERLLLWRTAPGKLMALRGSKEVALVAEQVPCDDYAASWTRPLGTGPGLQSFN
jgi:hypothetical protein